MYVSGVPHDGQNVRVTGREEWNSDNEPRTSEKSRVATVSHATAGEPAALQHVRQWQTMLALGRPVMR